MIKKISVDVIGWIQLAHSKYSIALFYIKKDEIIVSCKIEDR